MLSITVFGLAVVRTNSGFGGGVYDLSPKQISFTIKLKTIELPLYVLSTMLTKISICLFLLRIVRTNRIWKRAMYGIIALIVATNLSIVIAFCFGCKPVAKLWNPAIKGTCWPQKTDLGIYYYQGGKIAKKYTLYNTPYS